MYLASKWYIHLDRIWVIIYINFGTNQPPFFLTLFRMGIFGVAHGWGGGLPRLFGLLILNRVKRTTILSLFRAILPNQNKKISSKRLDLFIKYLFRPILCGFLLPWTHLLLSDTLWLLKISFCVSEAVIGRCSEIYSLEINAKPATRDINHFLIDVGRGLHSCLLPTKFRTFIQEKPPWFIICVDCSKDV